MLRCPRRYFSLTSSLVILICLQIGGTSAVSSDVYYYNDGADCDSSVQQACVLSPADSAEQLAKLLDNIVASGAKIVKFEFRLLHDTAYESIGLWSSVDLQQTFEGLKLDGYWLKDRDGRLIVTLNSAVSILSLGSLTVGTDAIQVSLNLSLNDPLVEATVSPSDDVFKAKQQRYIKCASDLEYISNTCKENIVTSILKSVVEASNSQTEKYLLCKKPAANVSSISSLYNYHCRNHDDEMLALSPPSWLSSVYFVLVVVEHIVAFTVFPFILLNIIPSKKKTGKMFTLDDESDTTIVIEDENLMTDSPKSPVSLTAMICRSTKAKQTMVRQPQEEHRSCCQIFWYSFGRFLLYCGLLPIFCHLGYLIYNVAAEGANLKSNFKPVPYSENLPNTFFYFFDQNFQLPFSYSLAVYGLYMTLSFLVVLSEADSLFTQTIEIDEKTFHHYYTKSCDLYDITRVTVDGRTIVFESIANFLRQAILNDCRSIRNSNCCLRSPLVSSFHHLLTVIKKATSLSIGSCCPMVNYLVPFWFLSFAFMFALSLHLVAEVCIYTVLGLCIYKNLLLPWFLLLCTITFYACHCLAKVQKFYSNLKNAIFHICCQDKEMSSTVYVGDTLHIVPVKKLKPGRRSPVGIDPLKIPRFVDSRAGIFKGIPVLADKAPRDSITKDTFKQVCDFVKPIGTAYAHSFLEFFAVSLFVAFMFTFLALAELDTTVESVALIAIAAIPYLLEVYSKSSISSVSEEEVLFRKVAIALSRIIARYCVFEDQYMATAAPVAVVRLSDLIATEITPLPSAKMSLDDSGPPCNMNGLTGSTKSIKQEVQANVKKQIVREKSFKEMKEEAKKKKAMEKKSPHQSRKDAYKAVDKETLKRELKAQKYKKGDVRLEDYSDDPGSQASFEIHRMHEGKKSSGRDSRFEMYTYYGELGPPLPTNFEESDSEKKKPRHSSSFGSSSNKLRKQNRREWVSDEDIWRVGQNKIFPEDLAEDEGIENNGCQDDVAV